MIAIELRFPARRFHATPWGRHVNEGVAEWPPSPYRLLRALYDGWKRKHADLAEAEVESVLGELAREVPRFRLPAATTSHTRSYLHTNTFDPTDKALIFDAFVAVAEGARCYLCWDGVELTAGQRTTLATLLGTLNYLGRSESWVEAALVEHEQDELYGCEPLASSGVSGETVPVACAAPMGTYSGKRPWLDALAYSTSDLIKERRSGPPALRMVQYVRPGQALRTRIPRAPVSHASGTQAVMLSLDSTVLPLVTATLELADQVRRRLMGTHRKIMGGDPAKVSMKFSGKRADGTPLKDHSHLYILPLAASDGVRIDRILLFTRDTSGLQPDEIRAILGLRSVYGTASDNSIRVVATWRGAVDDPIVRRRAKVVRSTTPFVPPRHWRKGRDPRLFLDGEVRRECANHGLPDPVGIEPLDGSGRVFAWVEFRRNRKGDPVRPLWGGFQLEFPEPVPTPFSLGYGSHFGLGQFEAT